MIKVAPLQGSYQSLRHQSCQNYTNLNWADIFTKPLSKVKHESLHRFIMGW